ncbi:MAG: tetratricopeptide repeat protein, partial [Planctomycetota bacterium]|nr:tetratricopeptide repeat protein [Planctomycetota bacterium]
ILPEDGSDEAETTPLTPEVLDVLRRMNDLLEAPDKLRALQMDATILQTSSPPGDATMLENSDSATTIAYPSGPPPAPTSQPSGFGRFTDVEFLAEGGMGQILEATDPTIDRRVAIKILRPNIKSHKRHLQKFQNEFRLTGQLEHPSIVPVHESGTADDGRVYFCMKLVQGESLAELLKTYRTLAVQQNKPFDPTPFLRHLLRVCDALSFAHSRGIVHRDLKPANLMVGAFGEVLVMDWGLAREIGGPGADPTEESSSSLLQESHDPYQTLEGEILGTPAYMAPEQARGEIGEIDEQTDVYALGTILYDILTGSPPQNDGTSTDIVKQVASGKFQRPSDRTPKRSIPAELEAVVMKAMAPDKRDRYRNAKDFQSDIQAYLDGRALGAAHYNPLQLLLKWVGRNRKVCAGGAAVFLLSLGSFGVIRLKEWRVLERKFQENWVKAERLVKEAGDISPLIPKTSSVHPGTKPERRETLKETAFREQAIEAYVSAANALDRALHIHPKDEKVRERRLSVGRAIGKMALHGRDYLLARQSFAQLENYGMESNQILELIKRVQTARSRLVEWRKLRLLEILNDLNHGLEREGRPSDAPLLADFVFEAVGYRDLQTVHVLGKNLQELVAKRQREGQNITWSESERNRAKFICRILGRLGLPECVQPLAEWMAVVSDHELAVEAGEALCNTRDARAQRHLLAAQERLGINSPAGRQIGRFFNRIPGKFGHEPHDKSPQSPLTAAEFYERGDLFSRKKKNQKAIDHYTRSIELNPKVAQAYHHRGIVLAREKNFDAAIADFSKALELNPNFSNAYLNRATTWYAKGNLVAALADLDRTIKLDSRDPDAYNLRGILYHAQGNFDAAIADYNRAVRLSPNDARIHLNRGLSWEEKGDLDAAITDYNRAITLDPRLSGVYDSLGRIYGARGDLDTAIIHFSKAVELDPKLAVTYHNRAFLFTQKGDFESAVRDYRQAIRIDPTNTDSIIYLGKALQMQGLLDRAIETYTQAIKLDPGRADPYHFRALASLEKKDLPTALQDLSKAIEIAPNRVDSYLAQGHVHRKRKDLEAAIHSFTRAIEIAPSHPQAHLDRGQAFLEKGDLDDALTDLDRAVELTPRNPYAHLHRGNYFRTKGNLEVAIQCYDQAIRIHPKLTDAYLYRGLALQNTGNVDSAIVNYRHFLRIAPSSASYYWKGWANLGFCLAANDQPKEALNALRKAHDLAPDHGKFQIGFLIQQLEQEQ